MEFVQGRGRYYCEDEQPEAAHNQHLPLLDPTPPCSSSFTQYSTRRPPTQQMDTIDYHNPSGSSSGSGGGSSEQHRPQAPFVEKEHMFDKVVTPSDVGKLNRLVIPKQHAERYFPLDASTHEKGRLLNFEDRTGKQWRFRYSYWNSSQSYVMTKGWSRFVKDKGLDAGDTVSFQRGAGEAGRDRLFIDWRRRPKAHDPPRFLRLPFHGHSFCNDPSSMMSFARSVVPWSHLAEPPPPPPPSAVSAMMIYDYDRQLGCGAYNAAHASNPYLYLRPAEPPSHVAVQVGGMGSSYGSSGDGGGGGGVPTVLESVCPSKATAKRVRLFGVNLDSSPSEADPDGKAIAYENSLLPLLRPPQSSLGSPKTVESPGKGKQSMSLDLEM